MSASLKEKRAAPAPWRDLAALALVCGALYFFLLGQAPLANPDEARYAEIPREMLASGDWVTPRLNGVNYFEKPPLVYWAIALSLEVFGPHEWAVRAVPALFALGGVLLTYAAMRRLAGRAAGLASAVVLGLSLFYFVIARIVLLDMAVSVLVSATLFFFVLGIHEPAGARRCWLFHGLYLSAALATLTKGLIGFLLPGAVMFIWLLLFAQWRRLRPFYLPTGAALFLIVTLPWHILAAQRNPTWAQFYFVHEHWERFTSTTHGRVQPWWFFVPLVLFGLFPWVGFLGTALRDALAGGWARRRENALAGFLVTWAVFIFLFFSKSQSKLAPYILPVFPPLAALIGGWLARQWIERNTAQLRTGSALFAAVGTILAAAVVVVLVNPGLARLDAAQVHALRPTAIAMIVVLLGGVTVASLLWLTQRPRALLVSMGATAAVFYGTLACGAGAIEPSGTREIARFVREHLPADARIYHYGDFFHDFVFYSGRFTGTVEFHGDEMELLNDATARASGRFIDESEFRRQWQNPAPIYIVIKKRKLLETRADYRRAWNEWQRATHGAHAGPTRSVLPAPELPVFADRSTQFQVLLETPAHLLITNLPNDASDD